MSVDPDFDVAIVGYGPIGEMAAIMLGRRGFRVGVFERWPDLYPLPRAVVYDDEIARLFQDEGVLDAVLEITERVPDFYEWHNRDGEVLLKIDWSRVGPIGRPLANFFSQPGLQEVLDRQARATPGVTVTTGCQVDTVEQDADGARLHVGRKTVTASYVIGADGANSLVRREMGVESQDLGFEFDWLIVDVHPHEQREWSPMNWQLCDPARPTTIVSGGPGRRRWEFMRLPGETIDELNTTETAWRLLEPWGRTPENTTIERHAVYTFQARWAKEWRRGRLLLAGDAAHLMPPFAGQGMCGGLRDLGNLVWKLDLVLRGRADAALLDTYGAERAANVQHFIHMSMALGQIICVLDPAEARQRDERMLAGGGDPAKVLPAGPPPRLGPGVLTDQAAAGLPMPQGRVRLDDRVGLLDTLRASGFLLLTTDPEVAAADLARAGDVVTVDVLGLGSAGAEDLDGVYAAWFDAEQTTSVLLRPDWYVFGTAASAGDASSLVADLQTALSTP